MIDKKEMYPDVPKIHVTKEGAEYPVSAIRFPKPFHIGLEYGPPARGTWTIAHSTMLIPELHQIFVCCACCLQGVVLTADELENGAQRYSQVTVTNENILKGDLEKMMIEGITDILNGMEKKPRCVEGFTSCIQHFLHIDVQVVYRELRRRFPEIDFIDGYMTPTLNRKFSPDVLGRRQLLRVVREQPRKRAVNFVVNYFPVDASSELVRMLRAGGYEIHDFGALSSYDEYQAMGESEANIYFLENAEPAALDLSKRMGQKAVYAPYSWDLTEIGRILRETGAALSLDPDGPDMPDLDACRREAEERLVRLRETIGDIPIAVDSACTARPLGLARLLLEHGFRVYAVYADEFNASEEKDWKILAEKWPQLLIRPISHYKMRLLPRDDALRLGGVLAIGQKAAYFTGTDHFVNMVENSGLYGYRGIVTLADWMEEAYRQKKDVKPIITVKAWGCRG